MIEKRLLQTERLDFSQLNIRADAHFAGIVRCSYMKSPSICLPGHDPLDFYGKSSENLDKSNHLLYNESKQRGKKRPADEVTGVCA